MQTGTYVDPNRAKLTIGALASVWLAGQVNLKPTTRALRGRAPYARPAAHGVLSGILGLAVRDRRLPSNPAPGGELPPLRQGRRRYLSAAQVEALADAKLVLADSQAVADRLDAVRGSARGLSADFLPAEAELITLPRSPEVAVGQQIPDFQRVETRGIEPLTPALQRRCSAN